MLTWITSVKEDIESIVPLNHQDFSIERMSADITNSTLSIACQFCSHFSYVHNRDSYISIPIPNKHIEKRVLDELVPYFKKVMKVNYRGSVSSYDLVGIKNETKLILRDYEKRGELYPILPDLNDGIYRPLTEKDFKVAKMKRFTIDLNQIKPLHLQDTKEFCTFLNQTIYTKDKALRLQPTEWWLDNDLQHSVTIRCFSTFASRIDLIVNLTTNQVIGLDVFK